MPGFIMPSRFIMSATDGTENQIVSSDSLMNLPGSTSVSGGGQHTHDPRSQPTKRSKTEMSKVMSNICEKRSSWVTPMRSTI